MVDVFGVELSFKKGEEKSNLSVKAKLRFNKDELEQKSKFKIEYETFGRDFGQSLDKDELLHEETDKIAINKDLISTMENGVYKIQKSYDVLNIVLDEDKGKDEDEIYVKVIATPVGPVSDSALSNIVKGHFEKL